MSSTLRILFLTLAALAATVMSALGQSSPLGVSVAVNGIPANVTPGGSVTMTANGIGQAVVSTVTVRYLGATSATISGISFAGASALTLVSAPVLPVTLAPNAATSFTIQYLPATGNSVSSLLNIGFTENGQSSTFAFTVIGASSELAFTFFVLPNGSPASLASGDRITFPATNLGSFATATVQILNRGSASGSLQSVTLSGFDFQVSGFPAPTTLSPGGLVSFNILYTPHSAGTSTGLMTLGLGAGSLVVFLSGTAGAPDLAMSYRFPDNNVHPIFDGVVLSFPSVDINSASTAVIEILNRGSGTGTVTGIVISGTAFQLSGVPLLPTTLAAGQSLRFNIAFTPSQPGNYSGTFRIDLAGRSISGSLSAATNATNFSVSYALTDGIVQLLADRSNISFPAVEVNSNTTAAITIFNQGPGTGTVTGIFLAASGFQLSGVPQLPVNIASGQSLRFGIVFTPSKAGGYSGTFRIDMSGRSISGTVSAATALSNLALNDVDPDTGNILPLANNSTLQLPNTLAGSSSSITVLAANTGAGTGSIPSIVLGGGSSSAFQLLNLPPLPVTVPPSQQLRFGIRFSPQQQQRSSDTLLVDLNGQIVTINLQAQGIGPQFSYSSIAGNAIITLSPGGTIALADTPVGQTSSLMISIGNTGTGDGQISALNVTGQGLSVTEIPSIPFTIRPNGSQRFTLNFAPVQPSPANGRLTIGSETFTITGTAIGSRLNYTYTNAVAPISVDEGGPVIFPPVAVGTSTNLTFSLQNTGTIAATISSINLAASSQVFALQQLPALPFNLNPGASVSFSVAFTPNNTGSLTATMRVNNSSFVLSGSGLQPASLPSYQFQGPAGDQQPARQPSVGLTLSAPYPLALQGSLKLSFISSVFTDDPSIQFASGGRTVSFTVPANSTKAMFNGNATTIALQTGTTAGSIVVTPSFAIQGGFDLTPTSPDVLTLDIPRSAPQLLTASVTAQTLTSFTLVVNGYATTRNIRQLGIQFTPRQGQNFSTTSLTLDVTSASAAWFQSTTSQSLGGSFLVAIPLILQNGSSTSDLVHLLESLSITATNDVGTSNAISVAIP